MSGERPLLTRLSVAAEPSAWCEAGFDVEGHALTAGAVTIALAGAGSGKRITSWELSGLSSTELDGLPTNRAVDAPAETRTGAAHPNGVTRLDHLVAFSPDLTAPSPRSRRPGWTCAACARVQRRRAPATKPSFAWASRCWR